ncbi:MAG TPA: hypothetical protein VHX65_12335 [Pirellulales bacterium]|nr:hypothetical protein [Pirellulales bacterium]
MVLAADKNIELNIQGILARKESLSIRAVRHKIFVHPESDPGCHLRCQDFLASFTRLYKYALVIHDHEGCGREAIDRVGLEADIENRLASRGWKDRCAAVVIEPELEAWVWSDSPPIATVLAWPDEVGSLRQWLELQGFSNDALGKPVKPKEALERVLRERRTPRSSSIYFRLAATVSLRRCLDPAFAKLRATFQDWFGLPE